MAARNSSRLALVRARASSTSRFRRSAHWRRVSRSAHSRSYRASRMASSSSHRLTKCLSQDLLPASLRNFRIPLEVFEAQFVDAGAHVFDRHANVNGIDVGLLLQFEQEPLAVCHEMSEKGA